MMSLSRLVFAPNASRRAAQRFVSSGSLSLETAKSAFEKSCYQKIDFKIPADAPVIEAVQKMAAHNIGCLAVTEGDSVV